MVNLEVPIEFCNNEPGSSSTGDVDWVGNYVSINTSDYDGNATYYFEILATNSDSTDKNILLINSSSTFATVTIPASTTGNTRIISSSFTPTSGTDTYYIRLPTTTSNGQVVVRNTRIIIRQTNPTSTRICIPMIDVNKVSGYSSAPTGAVDSTLSTSYNQTTPNKYAYFKKNESAFTLINNATPWTHEAIIKSSSASYTTYACLYNSNGNEITDSEVSTTSTSYVLLASDISNSATNFDNNAFIETKIKTSGANASINGSYIYLRFAGSLVSTEVYYRLDGARPTSAVGTATYGRMYYDANNFSNVMIYHEATGTITDGGTGNLGIIESTTDNGTGSDLSGGDITFSSTTKSCIRTSSLTFTDEDRYYLEFENVSGTLTTYSSFIVISSSGYAGVLGSSSLSPSASLSPSSSVSPSLSPSTSLSPSASVSPSPSTGWEDYTREALANLPTTKNDLGTVYSVQEYTDVSSNNGTRVGQIGKIQYMIHQFKNFVGNNNSCTLNWDGQTSCPPSNKKVYLQIYNTSTGWETVSSNGVADINTDFSLTANIADLTNYKDAGNVVVCRVYQRAPDYNE